MLMAGPRRLPPVIFIDFDNTVTIGDVLDAVIERFSATDDWRRWEEAWQQGELTTRECLKRQIANLRVTEPELLSYVASTTLDRGFLRLREWAERVGSELFIVSDSFEPIIAHILKLHAMENLRVFANRLRFHGAQVDAEFPYVDPACPRCAHCKAQHLARYPGRDTIYIGDGLSDVCPALVAKYVFAKDSLADHLDSRGVAFERFSGLNEVQLQLELLFGRNLDAAASTGDQNHVGTAERK